MADVVDAVPSLLGKIHEQLVSLNARNERLDTGQQRQTEVLVKLEAGQRLHTDQLAELNRRVEGLDGRVARLEDGHRELVAGQKELVAGQKELVAGQKELNARVGRAEGQLGEVVRILDQDFATRIVELERRMGVVEGTVGIGNR